MNATLVLLEVDPSIVRPGWVAGLVTILIALALVVLFFSLRKQVGRINPDLPYADELDDDGKPTTKAPSRSRPGGAVRSDRPAPDITGRTS